MKKITVAVFFGGRSNEREISVITGMLAVNLLRHTQFSVLPVYLPPAGGMATGNFAGPADFRRGAKTRLIPLRLERGGLVLRHRNIGVDVALNCCHGGMGEDGTLSALLRFYGIPLASPEAPMSAVFMNKIYSKAFARGLGVPTLESFFVREGEEGAPKYPVVVKPARLGSSIGISVARDEEEYRAALALAFRLDGAALVERYLAGKRDINCAAVRLGGETVLSPLEEVFSGGELLTFSEKYEGGAPRESVLPADLTEGVAEEIRAYTRLLYETCEGRGVVRADFLVAGEEVYFNELNTVPGSLACHLFAKSLKGKRDFLVSLLEETLHEAPMSKEVLSSGILESELFREGRGSKRR